MSTKHTYCGSRQTAGHGEADICGRQGPPGIYQCARCELAEASALNRQLLEALQAMLDYAPEPTAYSTACVHERARAAIAKATHAPDTGAF